MADPKSSPLNTDDNCDAPPVRHLKEAIASGTHWYIALLEAVAIWTSSQETYNGRHYQYLIAGEAFDWLLLAERLCEEIGDLVAEEEKVNLLFGRPPLELSREEFRALIGPEKYQAHLNYFYGVAVEQALHIAVETDMAKELAGRLGRKDGQGDAFYRIYGSSESMLLEQFQLERGLTEGEDMTFTMFKEFTYWLFKYRVKNCDSSRLASDTKKALEQLVLMRSTEGAGR